MTEDDTSSRPTFETAWEAKAETHDSCGGERERLVRLYQRRKPRWIKPCPRDGASCSQLYLTLGIRALPLILACDCPEFGPGGERRRAADSSRPSARA